MYPITPALKALFRANTKQVARITFSGVEDSILITDDNIVQGGLSVNRYCASGSSIEIGSAVAAEMSLKLNNFTGIYNHVVFGGAELHVEVGVSDGTNTYYVPLGYFTVDKTPKITDTIELKALDRMVLFDKLVSDGSLPFPCTVAQLLSHICSVCNVPLSTDIVVSNLPNALHVIQENVLGNDLTYRQVLSWIAEITGTCAFIDWSGHLVLKWFSSSGETIDRTIRYTSELETEDITLTGVQITLQDDYYLAGEAGYIVNIEGNLLIQDDYQTVVNNIYAAIGNFTYTPSMASIEPSPHLYPLDTYTWVDKDNNSHLALITDVTFGLNRNTQIRGRGETETEKSWAKANPLTKQEKKIIRTLQDQQNTMLNTRLQAMLELNELICNTTGLFRTEVPQEDGSVILYLHNAVRVEESRVIFTWGANGFAWTDSGWNDGSPVWKNGVTAAGEAFFRLISAEGINVEKVGQDYRITITPNAFQIYFKDMLVSEIEEDTMRIPRMIASDYVQVGSVRLAPHDTNGADIVFID